MDQRYEVYSLADRHFYETPDRIAGLGGGETQEFDTARREVPAGWRSARSGDWLHLNPVDAEGNPLPGQPLQGWKIHVSATRENADKVAAQVWDYCVPRALPFKFVPAPHLLHLRNNKYAGRDGSGKFVTVYPRDEEQLHTVLRELGALLDGQPGPYILTDLRWMDGPLYVRYGAFARRFCVNERGKLVPAIEDDQGRLVPDPRDPAFRTPPWVTLPDFLAPQLAARNATTVGDLPYRIEKALHFSNGGGVYQGTDTRDGRKVVLKEGRPYAGLAADGADAVTRLEREKAALDRLAGLGVAPEVRDWFTLGDHRFLVMDFLEGRTLNSFFAERHPLLAADPDPDAVAAYTEWALRIHRAVEEAVAAVHGRGLVFNDLHMFNIMVGPDESSVALLDFEAAAPAADRGRQVVAHPGFFAPPDRTGADVDRYALACLRLALFLPITTLLVVDRGKAAHLAEVIAGQFPAVPAAFLDEAVREITRGPAEGAAFVPAPAAPAIPATPQAWPAGRDSMVAGILAAATPGRDDRLFPGDIAQFSDGGGLGLAYGAAGVLYALDASGAPRYPDGEEWLLRHTDPVPPGTPLGLYDGLAGVAYLLDRLGHRQRALDLTETVLGEKWQRLGSDLHGGLAGLGLVLDHLAHTTGETELRTRAMEAAQTIADRITTDPEVTGDVPAGKRAARRAGLMRGVTGPALLFLRLHQRTGDPALLDLAAHALRADLARCVTRDTGAVEVDEGWRTMPYLGDGSVGVGLVLDDYLTARQDEGFARARDGILLAARSRFYAQPGLFQGRAGMVLHLNRTTAPGATPGDLAAQVRALDWYRMSYQGHIAFPGHQMMRLSTDLGTGTAGVLLALGAALGDTGAHLPFLPPPPRPTDRPHHVVEP
ncbi:MULTISPECIES: class III lanthionine synthetase LanKC [Streptomycetaceae]|uniref:Membrane translocator n=1 Tax=Streptantibioticus cattleyicolor (strain ATCC 35852 / DSM 46488 / JCM 4925 / NBRC 14057 / NRRL 8057) TaxID=1003195 RepID=F8K376_STREN|nr:MULTISPECIES: class III lanthionine synthetase LanKC [Streptomycetaceae]AEW93789.1 membrane translocator [Streptantibioticus cattleyicolor NRRL 8057 = DSM 46488]MYS58475.1 lantipeptide synthetase [Streptomyces sp. SID5468]CCB74135.1 putative membrane translocator [Streptantibioticus cattleyicolor NRRL 8057 = DSM 46488]